MNDDTLMTHSADERSHIDDKREPREIGHPSHLKESHVDRSPRYFQRARHGLRRDVFLRAQRSRVFI